MTESTKRSLFPMSSDTSTILRSVITAVIVSAFISGAGALVALKVQERDINQNASDITALEGDKRERATAATATDRRLTRLESSVQGNERRHDENYTRIGRQLSKLQEDIRTLLQRRSR